MNNSIDIENDYLIEINTKTQIPDFGKFLINNITNIIDTININMNKKIKSGYIIIPPYNIYWMCWNKYNNSKPVINIDIFSDKKYKLLQTEK